MDFLPGVSSHTIQTERMQTHYLSYGAQDGDPLVLIHGNLSTGRFYEHLLADIPDNFYVIMPDMRGFGDSEPLAIDGTRGLRDWADDTRALVKALGITKPVHLAGWSTGGAAIAAYATDYPGEVASLTFIGPVSPYGFGGCHLDGTPCYQDWAGTGGGVANPEVVQRLSDKNRSADSPFTIRNVMRAFYWNPEYTMDEAREDVLVDEVLKTKIGNEGYPGDLTPSENWPTLAPGTRGILNALSGKYCNWSDLPYLATKPPVLWTHGEKDLVIGDASALEMGTLGQMGLVPGWPGEEIYPPQPMVAQIRATLESYQANGGDVEMAMFPESGHAPFIDDQAAWTNTFVSFLKRTTA